MARRYVFAPPRPWKRPWERGWQKYSAKLRWRFPMTNSSIDFVGWAVETSCLFYFRSVPLSVLDIITGRPAARWRQSIRLNRAEHNTTYKRPRFYFLLIIFIPCLIHRFELSARESHNSHDLITQHDNIHVKTAHEECGDPRGYIFSGWQYCRCARIPRLTVSVPIMTPDLSLYP